MSLRWLLLLVLILPRLSADEQADRIAQIHTEAIGGASRLEALHALRATGSIAIESRNVQTIFVAAAPNLIWIETRGGGQITTQGYDGKEVPWQCVISDRTQTVGRMDPASAQEFVADCDFYDPLYKSEQRGFTLSYLGTKTVDGLTYECVRASRDGSEPIDLWLDPDTYFVMRQIRNRHLGPNRQIPIETRFSDFRPVAGVLLPFRISTYAGGRRLHVTELESVEANPEIRPGLFAMPADHAAATASGTATSGD